VTREANGELLRIRAYEEPDRYVLALSGELDISTVATFEDAALRLCRLGAKEVLFDISEVDFIDSTGLRAILTIKATCEEHSCLFTMTHGSRQANRLFELTRLAERLPFRRRERARPRREIQLWGEGAVAGSE
jgi:anti-sigma B factor antagonist